MHMRRASYGSTPRLNCEVMAPLSDVEDCLSQEGQVRGASRDASILRRPDVAVGQLESDRFVEGQGLWQHCRRERRCRSAGIELSLSIKCLSRTANRVGAVRLVAVPVEATAVLKRDGLARWRRNVDGKPQAVSASQGDLRLCSMLPAAVKSEGREASGNRTRWQRSP